MATSSAREQGRTNRRGARMERPDAVTTEPGAIGLFSAVRHGIGLTFALLRDPRVPTPDKLAAGAALVYLVSPFDLIVDWFPVLGQLDDLALIVWSWRRLVQSAGSDVVADLWRGDQRSMDLVIAFAGLE